jgi:hypothetical protein
MAVGFGAISQVQGEPTAMAASRKLVREVIRAANTMQYFLNAPDEDNPAEALWPHSP